MRILAIDPGFGRVGMAVVEKEKHVEALIHSECFTTSALTPFPERLSQIKKRVGELIDLFQPKTIALETLFFNKNQKTAFQVAEARGVMIAEAASRGLSVHEYTPLQVKIAITGYGRAPKDQVDRMVRALLHLKKEVVHDDEMDAMAVGLTAMASIRATKS